MARQMAEQFYQAWLQVTRVSGKLVPQLVQGWVKTRRSSKSVTFIQITDGSTLQDLQIVVDETNPGGSDETNPGV